MAAGGFFGLQQIDWRIAQFFLPEVTGLGSQKLT
jgi:hypothetical protein